jgi:uncharacterized membrane protein
MILDLPLPDHIETAIRDSASLHADHETSASTPERWTNRITAVIGQPLAVVVVPAAIALWLLASLVLPHLSIAAFDPPPFAWLQIVLAVAAVFMTVVILASQHRSQILVSRREQLMLQLAVSSDHKVAKVIALLEELRRDDPTIADRPDREAVAMATISDPQRVADAIGEAHDELIDAAKGARR